MLWGEQRGATCIFCLSVSYEAMRDSGVGRMHGLQS